MLHPRFHVLTAMILFAALARLIPHPWNLTPVAAMALFGGARFIKKSHAVIVPLAALIMSDLIIGVYVRMPLVYLAFGAIILIGFWLRKRSGIKSIFVAVLISSISFFLITNFGVWAFGTLYPKTLQGLGSCFTAALPFFRNALVGNLFYSSLLFGGFSMAEKKFPVLRSQPLPSGA